MSTTEFEMRDQQTWALIGTVMSRWQRPRLYRSYPEYQRELAAAYDARAQLYDDMIRHSIGNPTSGPDVLFSALLDARSGQRDEARSARAEADRSARSAQEDAWRSYADNLTAAAAGTGMRAVA